MFSLTFWSNIYWRKKSCMCGKTCIFLVLATCILENWPLGEWRVRYLRLNWIDSQLFARIAAVDVRRATFGNQKNRAILSKKALNVPEPQMFRFKWKIVQFKAISRGILSNIDIFYCNNLFRKSSLVQSKWNLQLHAKTLNRIPWIRFDMIWFDSALL